MTQRATDPLIGPRALAIVEEKVAVLNGDRGNPLDAALRRRELELVRAQIAALTRQANQLEAQLDLIQADLETVKIVTLAVQFDAPPATGDAEIYLL